MQCNKIRPYGAIYLAHDLVFSLKVAESQTVFSLGLKSPKQVPNHYLEHVLFSSLVNYSNDCEQVILKPKKESKKVRERSKNESNT